MFRSYNLKTNPDNSSSMANESPTKSSTEESDMTSQFSPCSSSWSSPSSSSSLSSSLLTTPAHVRRNFLTRNSPRQELKASEVRDGEPAADTVDYTIWRRHLCGHHNSVVLGCFCEICGHDGESCINEDVCCKWYVSFGLFGILILWALELELMVGGVQVRELPELWEDDGDSGGESGDGGERGEKTWGKEIEKWVKWRFGDFKRVFFWLLASDMQMVLLRLLRWQVKGFGCLPKVKSTCHSSMYRADAMRNFPACSNCNARNPNTS